MTRKRKWSEIKKPILFNQIFKKARLRKSKLHNVPARKKEVKSIESGEKFVSSVEEDKDQMNEFDLPISFGAKKEAFRDMGLLKGAKRNIQPLIKKYSFDDI